MADNDHKGRDNVPSRQNDQENIEGRQAQRESEENRYGYAEGGSFGRGTLGDKPIVNKVKRPIRANGAGHQQDSK